MPNTTPITTVEAIGDFTADIDMATGKVSTVTKVRLKSDILTNVVGNISSSWLVVADPVPSNNGYYFWNGSSLQGNSLQPARRLKVAFYGNSKALPSQQGGININQPYWSSKGVLNCFQALSQCGFDRVRTTPKLINNYTTTNNVEQIDQFGVYAWPGSQIHPGAPSCCMLDRLDAWMDCFLEEPDVIWAAHTLENDCNNWPGTVAAGLTAISSGITQWINRVRRRFPNVTIVYSTCAPSTGLLPQASNSYNSINPQLWTAVNSFVMTLPALYNNLIADNSANALALQVGATYVGQPDMQYYTYVSAGNPDGVHQSTRGAWMQALTAWNSWGSSLFPNPINLDNNPYNPLLPASINRQLQYNPDLSLTTAGSGINNNVTYDQTYNSLSGGANATASGSITAGNPGVTLTATGATTWTPGSTQLYFGQNGSFGAPVDANQSYCTYVALTVNNSVGLFSLVVDTNFRDTSNAPLTDPYFGPETELAAFNSVTGGMNGILPSGTKLVIQTPPFSPPTNAGSINYSIITMNIFGTLVNPTATQKPSITITNYSILSVDNILPKTLLIPNAVSLTATAGGAAGALSFTASTVTGLSAGMLLEGTNLHPDTWIVSAVSGSNLVSISDQVQGSAMTGTYLAYTPYVNRTRKPQQISITGTAVTPVYSIKVNNTLIPLAASNDLVTLPPGAAFIASWASGTPVFNLIPLG